MAIDLISLADALEFVVDNRGKTVPTEDSGIALIATNCVSNDNLYPEHINVRYVSNEIYNNWFRSHPKPNDILLTNKGSKNGAICLVPDPVNFCIAQDMVALRADESKIEPAYLFAALRSQSIQSQIKQLNVDSVIPHFKKTDFDKLYIPLFSKDIQQLIGEIYLTFSKKIELNRQMNETLEAMAQALFKSWFVDFDPVIDNALAAGKPIPDELSARAEQRKTVVKKENADIQQLFPDEFEFTEEMGWIPKGWEVTEVGKILKRLRTKVKYKKDEVSDYGKVPVYEQGSGILLGFHNNEPDIKASNEDPAFIFGDHTCVTKLSLESFSISANVIPLRGKDYPTIWVYYAVQDKQSFEEYRRHWMEFIIKPVISPSLELTEIFSKYVESFGAKQMKIQYQNSELAKLRDTLLPKLMSGELRIADAAMVEEA